MEKKLGNLIYRLRLEAGLSQQQVCQGLCSVAQFARIEQNMVPLETKMYVVWKKFQIFSPASKLLLEEMKKCFEKGQHTV